MPEPQEEQGGVLLSDAARQQLERYRTSHETKVLTILLCDLVSSTQAQSDLGNIRASDLVRAFRDVFRAALAHFDAQEVETAGDSVLCVFAAPSDAILFALRLQAAMRAAQQKHPDLPPVRVGLHQGQVVVERHEDGPKPMDIYGVQVSAASRIMDLALGGQVLCSRSVFDDARAILRGEDLAGLQRVDWRNHGPYRFKGVEDTHEICEAGEEEYAPLAPPPGGSKSWPAGDSGEELGWRPAAGMTVPDTNWRLEAKLGEGQFGEVWKAYNPGTKTHQVFKFCFKHEAVALLKREARLLSQLMQRKHPHIVEVYDVTEGGRPPHYLEMEYVEGPTLREWLAENPPLEARLELAAQVADALDAMHDAGIYHRDIKPSNILLEAQPDGSIWAKLTDFGLGAAEDPGLLESVLASKSEGVAGTWDYIAPELKAAAEAGVPGRPAPQTDIYSLGLTLFQLVTGDLRAQMAPGWEERLPDAIVQQDIARCMRRVPEERWARGADLAAALRGHGDRLRALHLEREREAQRRRVRRLTVVSAVALLFAMVTLLFGGYALHQRNRALEAQQVAVNERDRAETEHERAQWRLYALCIAQADQHIRDRRFDLAREVLGEAPEDLRNWEWKYLHALCHQEQHVIDHDAPVICAAYSPDGRWIASGDTGGVLKVWDSDEEDESRASRDLYTLKDQEVAYMEFAPSGAYLLAVYSDKSVHTWSVPDFKAQPIWRIPEAPEQINSAHFDPAGERIVVAAMGEAIRVRGVEESGDEVRYELPGKTVRYGLYSPGGEHIAAAYSQSGEHRIAIWEADKPGQVLAQSDDVGARIETLAFSPGGDIIAGGLASGTVVLWDGESGDILRELVPPKGEQDDAQEDFTSAFDVKFSPGGRYLLSAHDEGWARLWDVRQGNLKHTWPHLSNVVSEVTFLHDGERAVTVTHESDIQLWDVESGDKLRTYLGHSGNVLWTAADPTREQFVTASNDGSVRVWDASRPYDGPRITLKHAARGLQSIAFMDDTRYLLAGTQDDGVYLADTATGAFRRVVRRDEPVRPDMPHLLAECKDFDYTASKDRLVTDSYDGSVRIYALPSGELVKTLDHGTAPVSIAKFSPDGDYLLTVSPDGTVNWWQCADWQGKNGPKPSAEIKIAAISPDNQWVALGTVKGDVILYEPSSGDTHHLDPAHTRPVQWLQFNPASTLLASASAEHNVHMYRLEGESVLGEVLEGHTGPIMHGDFSHTKPWLLTASGDHSAIIWDLEKFEPSKVLASHKAPVLNAWFSTNGTRIFTASADNTYNVWDTGGAEPLLTVPLEEKGAHQLRVTKAQDRLAFVLGGSQVVLNSSLPRGSRNE